MTLRSRLRLHNVTQTMLEKARLHYPGREVVKIKKEGRYLELSLADTQGRSTRGFFDVEQWLENMDEHLPGIPWQDVPECYLARWLNTLQLNFMIEETLWTVSNVHLAKQSLPERLLSLPAEPCPILCADWPVEGGQTGYRGRDLSELPLTLRYILGSIRLPLSQLCELVPGDLLLLRQPQSYLVIGQKKLFHISYQGNDEVIVEQPIFEDLQAELAEEEYLLDWANLPVDIEFVLDSSAVTLGALNHLDTGSILPVKAGAEQRIKIYLNRKFFAIGELVALEGGGLAVEVRQINKQTEQPMSDADAE